MKSKLKTKRVFFPVSKPKEGFLYLRCHLVDKNDPLDVTLHCPHRKSCGLNMTLSTYKRDEEGVAEEETGWEIFLKEVGKNRPPLITLDPSIFFSHCPKKCHFWIRENRLIPC